MKTRTRLVNHVHGVLKSFGHRVKKYSAPGFPRQVSDRIPDELKPALQPILEMLASIAEQVSGYDREIAPLSTRAYPETALLTQADRVGPITALRYVLTIEDPRRIERSRNVGAYLGLRPRQRQSGQRDPELRITKAGDRELRRLLVQCAQQILGPFGKDSDLQTLGPRAGEPRRGDGQEEGGHRGGAPAGRAVASAVADGRGLRARRRGRRPSPRG